MRRKDREITDISGIMDILSGCSVMRLGLCDDGKPYVVPLNFGYEYADGKFTFYFHSAKAGRKLGIISRYPAAFIELDCAHELTVAEDACGYGYNYRSVMAEGSARIISDISEKKKALSLLMKQQTGRDFTFNDEQADSVAVGAVDITAITAKARQAK